MTRGVEDGEGPVAQPHLLVVPQRPPNAGQGREGAKLGRVLPAQRLEPSGMIEVTMRQVDRLDRALADARRNRAQLIQEVGVQSDIDQRVHGIQGARPPHHQISIAGVLARPGAQPDDLHAAPRRR